MSLKIVYFTRSGNSKRVAQEIGNRLTNKPIEITDDKNWKGIFGFIKAGYYSLFHKDVNIEIHGTIEATDEIILVAPMWTGDIANAAQKFLKEFGDSTITLVVTSVSSMLKKYPELSVYNIIKNKHNEEDIIELIVRHYQNLE